MTVDGAKAKLKEFLESQEKVYRRALASARAHLELIVKRRKEL